MKSDDIVAGGRIEWVDVCKFLSIWIVVLLHYGVPSIVDHWFHCFHMPVFFFLSGIVFDAEKYTFVQLVKRRASTLLRPYVAFGVIAYLFWSVVYVLGFGEIPVLPGSFAIHLLWDCTGPVKELWGGVQWFLPALFITEILTKLICRLGGKLWRLMAALLCLTVGWLFVQIGGQLPLALLPALSMIPVFMLGNMLSTRMFLLPKVARSRRLFLALCCCTIVTACLILNGPVNVREAEMGNPVFFLASAISGAVFMCVVAVELDALLKDGRLRVWILDIGKNTIVVLYFHRWLQGVVLTILGVVGYATLGGAAGVVLRVAMLLTCVGMSDYVVRIVNERAPWLIGR